MRLFLLAVSALGVFAQSTNQTTVIPKQDNSATGNIDFRELYINGSNYSGWKAPNSISVSGRLQMPSIPPPSNGSVMAFNTDGSQGWNKVPTYSFNDTNWSQTISTNMTTPGTYTLTLTPAPLGVSASITDSQYRLVGSPGAAELVTPTGVGTCNGTVQTSCTLQVISANSHTTPNLQSSTVGLQEAWNAGRTSLSCPDGLHTFYGTAKTGARDTTLTGTANCIIGPGSSNMTLIWANSIYSINLTGFAFNSLGTATGVTYVLLGTGSTSTGSSIFNGLRISAKSGGYGIDARRGHELRVANCLFHQTDTSGGGSAVLVGNVIHGDYFAGWFEKNTIIGDWSYGIEDRGSGIIAYKNGFNGPKNHIGFLNWISVVNVNGTAVTWASGNTFDLTWPGFVEIDGQIGLIQTVNSPTSITLSNNLGVIASGKLRHGSTGQVHAEGNSHDSGTAWYEGGFVAGVTLNSMYSFRVINNFCSNWLNSTFTNCIYFSMPNASSVVISNNSIQNSVGTGSHYGINISDIGDAVIIGNTLNGYTAAGIYSDIAAANNPVIKISSNKVKCNLAAAATYGILAGTGRFSLADNTVEDCDIGVLADAGAVGLVTNTTFVGTVAAHYQLNASSTLTVQDLVGVAYADLIANAANGTLLYCSNCTAGSTPCSGASTGAFAKRINGVWQCN